MSGFFLEILADGPNQVSTTNGSAVDLEIIVTHASTINEMPGPASVEIAVPTLVRRDYVIDTVEPTDPAVMIWYKLAG
jgi:hypothetical protein